MVETKKAVLVLLILAIAAPARAHGEAAQDEARANKLFELARALMSGKRYDAACPMFLESYRLDTTKPGSLYALAECYAEAGKVASAVARYDEYMQVVVALSPERRQKHEPRVERSKAQREALSARVPTLRITLPVDAPRDTRVMLDGEKIPEDWLGKSLPIDPGPHRLTAQAPGGELIEMRLSIALNQRGYVKLAVHEKRYANLAQTEAFVIRPSLGSATFEVNGGISAPRAGSYVAFGIGASGLLVGAVTGGLTLGKAAIVDQECHAWKSQSFRCTAEGKTAADTGKTLGAVSTAGFIVGTAALAAGVTLMVIPEPQRLLSAKSQPRVEAGVLRASSSEVLLGLRGTW